MNKVPAERIRKLNESAPRGDGEFVLYWMTANRRLHSNYSLQRAIEWAAKLNKPVLVFEALRCDYRWASVRLHQFILQGMHDNCIAAKEQNVGYYPYVEPSLGAGSGLLKTLASRSCVVVTDDFPCFFLPRMQSAVARRTSILMESVASNGLFPMRSPTDVFPTAYAFRRFLQKNLGTWLPECPADAPLSELQLPTMSEPPADITAVWPAATVEMLTRFDCLRALPICHSVGPGVQAGGSRQATARLQEFLNKQADRYGEDRNHPDQDASSGLSAYLHFGHISSHQIFQAMANRHGWTIESLGDVKKTRGSRSGWWGMPDAAESFLDELVTWRELGFNMCANQADFDQYESLPAWAQQTLEDHANDPRPWIYDLESLSNAATHDAVWNAAQTQLMTEGRMHNYLRMLWGKKILEWSASPREALSTMIELNNRFALDGRNPNSYSGIFWVLGRYDRAWGPERPIYGKIRYMTSENTLKKLLMADYMRKYSAARSVEQQRLF